MVCIKLSFYFKLIFVCYKKYYVFWLVIFFCNWKEIELIMIGIMENIGNVFYCMCLCRCSGEIMERYKLNLFKVYNGFNNNLLRIYVYWLEWNNLVEELS